MAGWTDQDSGTTEADFADIERRREANEGVHPLPEGEAPPPMPLVSLPRRPDPAWTVFFRSRDRLRWGRFAVLAPDRIAAEFASQSRLADDELIVEITFGGDDA